MRLISSFSKSAVKVGDAHSALDEDTMRRVTPSVFAEHAHPDRSNRYLYLPTWEIVEALGDEGFRPTFAAQSSPRRFDKIGFTKHLIRFRRESDIANGSQECPEIVLLNSHGGESQLQLIKGTIRFLCLNSMISGDMEDEMKVRHAGKLIDNVVEAASKMAGTFDQLMGKVDSWKQIRLNRDEQLAYADSARDIRCPSPEENERPRGWRHPIAVEEFLALRRPEDNADDLWTVSNVVQENTIRGGLEGVSVAANGQRRRTSTRAINAVGDDVRLNRALWKLTERMAALKGA
jgi:hypothetical protein